MVQQSTRNYKYKTKEPFFQSNDTFEGFKKLFGYSTQCFNLTEPRHENPVFGVSDQVRLKPACSATETN